MHTRYTFGRALLLAGALLAAGPVAAQWTAQNSGLAAKGGIQSISVVDASTAWAAGYNGNSPTSAYNTYTRTTNGGSTWTTGTVTGAGSYVFLGIGAASSTAAWAALNGTSSGGYLYHTTDGSTWTRQLSTGFPSASGGYINGVLAFSADQAVVAGDPLTNATKFEVYTTSNAGSAWAAATTPTPLSGEYGRGNTLVTVPGSTASARACWFGTTAGRVLRSTDSGATWTAATTGLAAVTALAFSSTSNGLALNADDPGTVAYTTDGGATWTTVAPTGTFYTSGLSGVPGSPLAFVSTGNDNNGSGSAYSLDGGKSWTSIDAGVAHTAVQFLSGSLGYAGGFATSATAGGIYKGRLPVAPTATGLSPTSGAVGSTVTISGTNLGSVSGITFGGVAATTYVVNADGTITVTVPAGASTGSVVVTTAYGTTDGITFTVTTVTATAAEVAAARVSVYPNPANAGRFTVLVPALAGTAQVQATVYDALGRPVAVRTTPLPVVGASLDFSETLAAGVYVVRVQAGELLATRRVTVE